MSKMLFIWCCSMILLTLMSYLAFKVKSTEQGYDNKWINFECGFLSLNPVRVPFSFQFFLVSLLFLIFDVEISMILAYPLENLKFSKTLLIYLFITILTLGLFYEWEKGKLSWPE